MPSELDQYDYELPRALIAQQPLSSRADARLMVVDRAGESVEHHHVRDLPSILGRGDRLVLNDTRVIPARLVGHRTTTGGRWEGLFLAVNPEGVLKLLCKSRGKLTPGETVTLVDREARESTRLRMIQKLEDGAWLVRAETDEEALTLLERVGRVPLPHYIRGGEMVDADLAGYQTLFAARPGAVAAPTAGLHFTAELIAALQQRGVESTRLTLHVGPGTFRPISADSLDAHQMHAEWAEITAEAVDELNRVRDAGGRVVAVGSTSLRTLETAARSGQLEPFTGETDLFIRPPYQFRAVDALLTNFHLPRTTLLVLVHTFGGHRLMRRAYQQAIAEQYRFYSYGDAMLIL